MGRPCMFGPSLAREIGESSPVHGENPPPPKGLRNDGMQRARAHTNHSFCATLGKPGEGEGEGGVIGSGAQTLRLRRDQLGSFASKLLPRQKQILIPD